MPHNTDFKCFLADEDATLALGARLSQNVAAGMVIFLEGNLGAGKTTLSRGLLRGLGFSGRVKSPTYTLVEPYTVSNLYLYHFDLYRFNDASEWEDAGFRDYFNPESICLIEWADKAEGLLPTPDWIITLTPEASLVSDQTSRMAHIQAFSEQGQTCLNRLQQV